MSVRAKFKCVSKQPNQYNPQDGDVIKLSAVVSGSAENESFFKWTPSAEMSLATVNPSAAAQFEVGKEYYIDISLAE